MRSGEAMNSNLRLLSLLGVLAVAGCAGAPSVYSPYVSSAYNRTEFGVGAGRKDLEVDVRGDPFEMGHDAFSEAVVEALQRHQPRPQPTHFTLKPGEGANPAYRAVLLFDAPPAVNALSACRSDVPVVETAPDAVRVHAMFCRNQGTLTKITGGAEGVQGVDDPKFDALIGQIVAQLFPLKDPQRDDRNPLIVP